MLSVTSANRDLSLDFLKGIAILVVIFEHSIASWHWEHIISFFPISAVPIFLCVTIYLSFMKLDKMQGNYKDWFAPKRILALFKNLLLPFLIVTILGVGYQIWNQCSIDMFYKIIKAGGAGPGSYYIWMFLQMWCLMPFFYNLLNRTKKWGIILIFALCIVLNVVLSYSSIPNWLYRLLCIRYIVLFAVAYLWIHIKEYNKYLIAILGLLSYLYMVLLKDITLEPFVFNGGWFIHNYPCYFFTLLIIFGLLKLWEGVKSLKLPHCIVWCGENSWYLFLSQMLILSIISVNTFSQILNISGGG